MTKAPSRAAVSASVVSGFASGSRMAARNKASPAMPACQLFHRLSGRITSEAPATARTMRKATQLRRSRRRLNSLGRSSTSAKTALRPKLRSRAATVSCWRAIGVEVVLITVTFLARYSLTLQAEKNKSNSSRLGAFKAVDFAHAGEGAADVRDSDGAADDKGDIEGVNDFVALPTFFAAAHEMVRDAVVAAENGAGDQAEEFFGFGAERAGLIGLMVEGEEALDAEVAAAENFFVEIGAKFLEVVEIVGHGSSGVGFCHR